VAYSGDSNALLPPFNLGELVMQQNDHTKENRIGLSCGLKRSVCYQRRDPVLLKRTLEL
jgi:hypothetical protein